MHSIVRALGPLLILGLGFTAAPPAVDARQLAIGVLSVNRGVLAQLTLSANSIAFPDASPDVMPQVPAAPLTVTAKARATRNASIRLTVLASDNLRSGVNTIPVDALTWTASGPGFLPGTVSRTAAQTVGAWTGSGARIGTQTYQFRNLWTYATGTYTVTLTYTLSAP